MIKRTILIMMISGLLTLAFLTYASAEEVIKDDPKDDVYDMTYLLGYMSGDYDDDIQDYSDLETTSEKPYIDIKQVSYYKEEGSKAVVIILDLYDDVRDSGITDDSGLDEDVDFLSILKDPIISYIVTLTTHNNSYQISYQNNTCILNGENLTTYSKTGSTLTFNFELDHKDEEYYSLKVDTSDFGIKNIFGSIENQTYLFADFLPDPVDLDVKIKNALGGDLPKKAKVGENISLIGNVDSESLYYDYYWDLGDGNVSYEQNPIFSYSKPGTYTVILEVYDEYDNYGDASFDIVISEKDDEDGSGSSGDLNLYIYVGLIATIVVIGGVAFIIVSKR